MKKLFTFLVACLATMSAFADKYEFDLSSQKNLTLQDDGSYAITCNTAWADFKTLVWYAGWDDATKTNVPFDASAYNYLVVEFAKPVTYANQIVLQNGSWQAVASETATEGDEYVNVTLDDVSKTTSVQVCINGAEVGTTYIKSVYFSTEKKIAEASSLNLSSIGTNDGTGVYTITGNNWAWHGIWLGSKNYSDYTYIVADLAEPVEEGQAKIQIQYNGVGDAKIADTEEYVKKGQMKIYAKLDEQGKASVSQVGVQGESDFKVSALYATNFTADINAASNIASYSNDVAMTVPEDVDIYIATAVSASEVTLTKLDGKVIPAGEGVILYSATAGKKYLTVGGTSEDDFSGNKLVGTADKTYVATGSEYAVVAGEQNVGLVASGVEVPANKAYLASVGSAKLTLNFGGATAIKTVATDNAADAVSYNLAGQRVASGYKGIVVKGGKKYVVK